MGVVPIHFLCRKCDAEFKCIENIVH